MKLLYGFKKLGKIGVIFGLLLALWSCFVRSNNQAKVTLDKDAANIMFRSTPQHLGVSAAIPFGNVKLKWRFETKGSIRGAASLNDNFIFVGSADGHLYALDKNDGAEKWKFKTNGAVYSTPAIYKNKVIFTSRDHTVYAVDITSGELQWKFEWLPAQAHKWGWDYFLSSPTIVEDDVFFGAETGVVYSLDAASGKENWKFKTNGTIRATPAAKGGVLYVGSFDAHLYALETATGRLLWKFETDGARLNSDSAGWDRNSIDSSPAVTDTALVFGSRDGNVYALNTKTGKQYWKFSYGPTWALSSPAIHNGTVYVGWSDNYLFTALDLTTGKEKWKYTCGHYVYSSPLVTDTLVYVGSHDRNLYALNTGTGKKIWQYKTNGSILSSPVTDGESLLIGSDDGFLYAFERSTEPQIKRAVYAVLATPKYYPVDSKLGPYLIQYGYESLDTVSLETFMNDRIKDKDNSVIVFATHRVPTNVWATAETDNKNLFRKYLETGGKIIWPGAMPNLYIFDPHGNIIGEDASSAERTLGISVDATHDWGSYFSSATQEGIRWGLRSGWVGSYSIRLQEGITVLAFNDLGRPSAWFKTFDGEYGAGFVFARPWEVGRSATDSELEIIRKLAEYGF